MKDIKFDHVTLLGAWSPHSGNNGGFRLGWSSSKGFGTITFILRGGRLVNGEGPEIEDAVIECDNEMEDRDFIKAALCHFVDNVKLLDPVGDE